MRIFARDRGPWAVAYRPRGRGPVGGMLARDAHGWLLTFGIRSVLAVGVGWIYREPGGIVGPSPDADTVPVMFHGGDRG